MSALSFRLFTGRSLAGRLSVAIALLVAAVSLAQSLVQGRLIHGVINRAEREALSQAETTFRSTLDVHAREVRSVAETLGSLIRVRASLAEGDRAQMLQVLGPVFKSLQARTGISQMQVHTPDVHSFLRVNKPDQFGDDLSSFRHMLVQVNRDRVSLQGLEDGVSGLAVRGAVPVTGPDGRHVGSLEAGFLIQDAFLSRLRHDGIDFALYARREKGVQRLAASDPSLADGSAAPAVAAVLDGGERQTVLSTGPDGNTDILLAPVADYSGRTVAVLEVSADRARFAAEERAALVQAILSFAVAAVSGGLVAVWLARALSRPILRLTGRLTDLAGGNLEDPVTDTARSDEIGRAAAAVADLRLALQQDRRNQDRLAAEQQEKIRRAAQVQAVIAAFDQAVAESMGRVATASEALSTAAAVMADVAARTGTEAVAVSAAVQDVSSRSTVISAAAEELCSAIAGITAQIDSSAEKAAGADAEAARAGAAAVSLAETVGRIGDVTDLISAIASQTNLLALNATIEAARAGDAGKGFAVVAGEVKTLASQTAQATVQINAHIRDVRTSTQDVLRTIEAVRQVIIESGEIARSVSQIMDEETVATKEITRNITETSDRTAEVTQMVADVELAAGEARTAAATVKQAAEMMAEEEKVLRQLIDRFIGDVRQ
ncbi:methyl-accepting chemotaxis protein [Novispirillum itersonii]|uniref:methyl-accepting chemotaxis protein n=1 Tax=Novispirillum itersonii TaxID=189 RepID=UPI00146F9281|nr:methyl-accepting chemotaxis protein [Novispirillum itersonii]